MVSPDARRQAVGVLVEGRRFSQRRACKLVSVARSTARYRRRRQDDPELVAALQATAQQHPAYGYRPVTALLKRQGWQVNAKRIHRLWKQAGLQQRRRKRYKRRLGAAAERLQRATRPNHVWSYDFLSVGTERGGKLRILAVIDEFTRECLALFVARSISSKRVIHLLRWLFATRATPQYLRSDNGPEFVARNVQDWLQGEKCQTLYIRPGSPWENGFIESFNGKLRAECLDRWLFGGVRDTQQIVEAWREEYNLHRPHSALGFLSPAVYAHSLKTLTPTGT